MTDRAHMVAALKPGDRVLIEAIVQGPAHGDRIGLRTASALKIGGMVTKPAKLTPVYFTAPLADLRFGGEK